MLGSLFIRSNDHQSLQAFGKWLFARLKVKMKEIRDSENSLGGSYLVGEALGLRVTLQYADDRDFPAYEFLLGFRPLFEWSLADPHSLDGFAGLLAKHLAREGLNIARPYHFGKAGTERAEYGPKN